MIEEIEILQHRESCNFCCHPCEEALWLLCIVAYHHQVVVQPREHRLYSLSEFLVSPSRWSPVLLAQPVWYFKYDVGRGEQVLLNGSAQIPLVAKYHAVMIFPPHIFQIMEVMHIGGSHIKRSVSRLWYRTRHGVYSHSSASLAMRNIPMLEPCPPPSFPLHTFSPVHSDKPLPAWNQC